MVRVEDHLHNVFLTPSNTFWHLLMIASVLIHFVSCVNQFPVSISRNLIISVSLGLRKNQSFDLVYRLVD